MSFCSSVRLKSTTAAGSLIDSSVNEGYNSHRAAA
jgi:hypothetical protein